LSAAFSEVASWPSAALPSAVRAAKASVASLSSARPGADVARRTAATPPSAATPAPHTSAAVSQRLRFARALCRGARRSQCSASFCAFQYHTSTRAHVQDLRQTKEPNTLKGWCQSRAALPNNNLR
jgi:hypothetical protein